MNTAYHILIEHEHDSPQILGREETFEAALAAAAAEAESCFNRNLRCSITLHDVITHIEIACIHVLGGVATRMEIVFPANNS